MNHLRLFAPSKQAIIGIIMINALLFSGVIYYEFHNVQLDATHLQGSPSNFYNTGSVIYWIETSANSDFSNYPNKTTAFDYSLGKYDGNTVHYYPLINYALHYSDLNGTFLSLQIVSVQKNQALIFVREHLYIKTGHTPSEIQTSPRLNLYNYYFILLGNLNAPNPKQVSYKIIPFKLMDGMALNQISSNRDIGASAWIITVSKSLDIGNKTYIPGYYYIYGSQLLETLAQNLDTTTNEVFTQWSYNEVDDGYSVFPNSTDQFNLIDFLLQHADPTLAMNMITNQALSLNLQFIDSHGFMHFTGDFRNAINIEGNYTGLNLPDYIAINPFDNVSRFWELLPVAGHYRQLTLLPSGNSVIMIVEGSLVGDFYSNSYYNYASPNFDDAKLTSWYQQKYLQIAVFTPFSPTVKNYIQFDKTISQTNQSTVVYPRIPEAYVLPINMTYGSSPFYPLMTQVDGTPTLQIYDTLYDTPNGLLASLNNPEGTWTSNGLSLITLNISLEPSISYTGYKNLRGPQEPFKGDYPNSDAIPTSVEGWSIRQIWGAFHINTLAGEKSIVFCGGYFVKTILNFLPTKVEKSGAFIMEFGLGGIGE